MTPHLPLDKTPTPNDAMSRTALEEIKSVFVIDDEPVVCSTVQRSLGVVRTRAFTRAQEALDVIASLDRDALPDVIICDMMMPEMNGIELYRELERIGLAQRVFFITGGSTHDEVSSFLAGHPSRVLYKPFSSEALRAQVLKTRRRAIVC